MNRQEKLIAEIHAEFDSAQDRLLEQANKILLKPIDFGISAVESIGERLAKVGFTNTPTVKKAEKIKQRKGAEIKKVVETREQAELIQYYQTNYPFLKFLTEAELDRICKKYNLIYAPSDAYIEEVPEKNLRDIETAQSLSIQDKTTCEIELVYSEYDKAEANKFMKMLGKTNTIFTQSEIDQLFAKCHNQPVKDWTEKAESTVWLFCVWENMGRPMSSSCYNYKSVKITERSGIFIAAPKSHFNLNGLVKSGLGLFRIFETKVKDPIVFRYVRGGIQVLTKWGLEANDPDLVVPKLN